MIPHRTPECVIVGGGLSGAMAALRLAEAGREVLLIEREQHAHHKVCGEFLSAEAVAYLGEAGLDPEALGAATIQRLRLSTGESVVETTLPFTALSLSRWVLDELLLERAATAGCQVVRGLAVEKLTGNAGQWEIGLSDGTPMRATQVFLGTGKHDLRSQPRPPGVQPDLVGFKMHWRLRDEQTRRLRGVMELFLFDGGYGGLSLVEQGTANLCLVVRKSRLRALGSWPGVLDRIIHENRQVRRRLSGAEPLWKRPLAVSSIPYGYLAEHSQGVWRLGDQAAVIPSFTGDGMSIALHSATLAVDMFLAGKEPDEYLAALRGQLRGGMRLATMLSRMMVTPAGRHLAPIGLGLLPVVLRWIAAATRIPVDALETAGARWRTPSVAG